MADPRLLVFEQEYLPNVQAATVTYDRWRKQQPGEYAKWVAFRDAILRGEKPAPPVMSTRKGRELVAAGKEHIALSSMILGSTIPPTPPAPTPPPPPPPSSGQLAWAPPTPGGTIVNWTITNANRQSGSLLTPPVDGADLVITSGEALTGPVIQLGGGGNPPRYWRHVIWIGGKITEVGLGDRYALPIAATGTVHIEGLDIRCDGDALMSRGGSASCNWQVQNCRFEVHFNGGSAEHSDCFQFQGGTKINNLRFDKCTMVTDYQGFMMRFPDAAAFMNAGDFRRLNFRRRIAGQDPQQAFLFIPDEDSATGHGPGQPQIGNTNMTDVWVEGSHSSGNWILYPSWLFEGAFGIASFGNKEGIFRETDANGQYVRPSTTSDVVPPGGSASGQQCEPAGWTGVIRMGVPSAGDFCPSGLAGHGYTSPGYQA